MIQIYSHLFFLSLLSLCASLVQIIPTLVHFILSMPPPMQREEKRHTAAKRAATMASTTTMAASHGGGDSAAGAYDGVEGGGGQQRNANHMTRRKVKGVQLVHALCLEEMKLDPWGTGTVICIVYVGVYVVVYYSLSIPLLVIHHAS